MDLISHISYLISAVTVSQVEMAEELRSSGKIYVVVAVVSVIFIGLAIYLITIDKKLGKIERESDKHQINKSPNQ